MPTTIKKPITYALLACLCSLSAAVYSAQQPPLTSAYTEVQRPLASEFPPAGSWPTATAQSVGMDPQRLQVAVEFALSHENSTPKDQLIAQAISFGAREPFDQVIGPTNTRAGATGLVIYQGKLVAQWGSPDQVDMAHSISKTFLTTLTGLAWQQGLIKDLDAPVATTVPALRHLFASDHNSSITWQHLLRQTSDWQGTLWGKPDWADRPEGKTPQEWPHRPLRKPGSYFKYNDVRMNLLSLATLHVWQQALPDVLAERIMRPIGASNSWRWHGYDNSWVQIKGQQVQSVSAGGHWGGGLFINSWDLARFGYLMLHQGQWQGRQLIDPRWIQMASTPGPANPTYGFANWFLNTTREDLPAAPASAVYFEGNGRNIIYLDREHDLLVVARWVEPGDALNQLISQLLAALPQTL